MIMRLKNSLRRFRKDENGAAFIVEFAIMLPLIFGCFLMSVEMSLYSMRNMFLDRGLDMTVRYVRLHTNENITHTQLKDMTCDFAGFLKDCDNTLRLEMATVDPRAFSRFDRNADCIDVSQPLKDPRGFDLGREHQLMIVRACVKFKPVFPSTGLGYAFLKDGSGSASMFSTAAFVQEPN